METNIFYEVNDMSLSKAVANARFQYHANAIEVSNCLNQLKILKDEKAEIVMKRHFMECLDALHRLNPEKVEAFLKEIEAN